MLHDTDKLVVAILAASKAAAEKRERPGEYIAEYERMLKIFERRAQAASGTPISPTSNLPSS